MKNQLVLKRIVLIMIALNSIQSFSQSEKNISNLKNEIKLDVFDLAFFTVLDVSYERVSNKDYGYGISVFANFRKENSYYEKFAVTPFFRFYFFNKEDYGAKGFFAEVFSKFASGANNTFLLNNNNTSDDQYFDVALGIALGKKWINKKGFSLEVSFGGGRNLGLDENSPELTARGGISLGYRF